jgi:5-methylcytosine-specific restriction endonuclease McrA
VAYVCPGRDCQLKRRTAVNTRRAQRLSVPLNTESYDPKNKRNIRRLQIAERDLWICQLCRKPVYDKYRFPHPKSASIDHIIPVAHGGNDERRNLQLVHLICNHKRSIHGPAQMRLLP